VLAKTTGISFIDGLETKEGPALADTLCAGLAGVAVLAATVSRVLQVPKMVILRGNRSRE